MSVTDSYKIPTNLHYHRQIPNLITPLIIYITCLWLFMILYLRVGIHCQLVEHVYNMNWKLSSATIWGKYARLYHSKHVMHFFSDLYMVTSAKPNCINWQLLQTAKHACNAFLFRFVHGDISQTARSALIDSFYKLLVQWYYLTNKIAYCLFVL